MNNLFPRRPFSSVHETSDKNHCLANHAGHFHFMLSVAYHVKYYFLMVIPLTFHMVPHSFFATQWDSTFFQEIPILAELWFFNMGSNWGR